MEVIGNLAEDGSPASIAAIQAIAVATGKATRTPKESGINYLPSKDNVPKKEAVTKEQVKALANADIATLKGYATKDGKPIFNKIELYSVAGDSYLLRVVTLNGETKTKMRQVVNRNTVKHMNGRYSDILTETA